MYLFWFGQGVIWVGILCSFFYVLVFLCFWPGMVLNQGQLSTVVSDWEPYLGSFFPAGFLWVVNFCLVFCILQDCFGYSLVYFCYSVQF